MIFIYALNSKAESKAWFFFLSISASLIILLNLIIIFSKLASAYPKYIWKVKLCFVLGLGMISNRVIEVNPFEKCVYELKFPFWYAFFLCLNMGVIIAFIAKLLPDYKIYFVLPFLWSRLSSQSKICCFSSLHEEWSIEFFTLCSHCLSFSIWKRRLVINESLWSYLVR